MVLDEIQLKHFIDEALPQIQVIIQKANASGVLKEFAENLGLSDLLGESISYFDGYDKRRAKILVIDFQIRHKDDLALRAKKEFGIAQNRIEFLDYKSNFNFNKLKYNTEYSDIIVGANPHSVIGKDEASSFLALVDKQPDIFPKVHRATNSNGELKLTNNSFIECLRKSNLVKDCLEN